MAEAIEDLYLESGRNGMTIATIAALAHGLYVKECPSYSPDNVTKYKETIERHPVTNEIAIKIDDVGASTVETIISAFTTDPTKVKKLRTMKRPKSEMVADGWFPEVGQ